MAELFGWRITKEKHAKTAFSGEGSRLFGGRWNSPGVPIVYCSEHLSLAVLEILVHTAPAMIRDRFRAYRIHFDEHLVTSVAENRLTKGWDAQPPAAASQKVGDEWVKSSRSAVLATPTVLVPIERTLLVNPRHPDFAKIRIKDMGTFRLDRRLKV